MDMFKLDSPGNGMMDLPDPDGPSTAAKESLSTFILTIADGRPFG